MLRAVRRRPWRSALAVRWAFGARVLLPIACGASHLRLPLYLTGTLLSSVVWSAVFVGIGYAFGDTAVGVLRVVRRYDQWIVLGFVFALALVWAAVQRRREGARPIDDAALPSFTAEMSAPELTAPEGGRPNELERDADPHARWRPPPSPPAS
jgi:hypothetical protein